MNWSICSLTNYSSALQVFIIHNLMIHLKRINNVLWLFLLIDLKKRILSIIHPNYGKRMMNVALKTFLSENGIQIVYTDEGDSCRILKAWPKVISNIFFIMCSIFRSPYEYYNEWHNAYLLILYKYIFTLIYK